MKRPSFQFYPADWLRDTALRTCSVGARGLWIDMICFMHEGAPYGHLKVGNKVILPSNLAGMVGATLLETEGWLAELESGGVFERTEEGCILSRRMIRDENLRNLRASGGKLGGNPALKVNLPPNLEGQSKVNRKPTPSSSSSSSSSKFSKPSVGELIEYGKTLNPPFTRALEFLDHYESNGWKVGKTGMKDWKASVRTWQRKQPGASTATHQPRALWD